MLQIAQKVYHEATFLLEFGAGEDLDLRVNNGNIVVVRRLSSWWPRPFW